MPATGSITHRFISSTSRFPLIMQVTKALSPTTRIPYGLVPISKFFFTPQVLQIDSLQPIACRIIFAELQQWFTMLNEANQRERMKMP